jgi:hypothetical protein
MKNAGWKMYRLKYPRDNFIADKLATALARFKEVWIEKIHYFECLEKMDMILEAQKIIDRLYLQEKRKLNQVKPTDSK